MSFEPISIEAVHPDLRAATLKYGKNARVPDSKLYRMTMQAALAVLPFGIHKGVRVNTIRGDGVHIRHHRPLMPASRSALLWIHGGGLVGGSPRQDDPLCSGTAAELQIQVFAVRYPLAPEHPFPEALDQIWSSWKWLLANAEMYGIDRDRIIVGGESAGGGLAAALVQRIHDAGGVQPKGQWLFAPMLDDRTAARRELDPIRHWIWSNAANRFGWCSYLNAEPGADYVPQYSVPGRRADLAGLPPTFLAWGDIELFAEENRTYADRLKAAGVPTEIDVVAGAPHGFENWAHRSEVAVALLARARAWLRRTLDELDR